MSKKTPLVNVYTNKAIIYARVSSKDQEVEGFSIPAQLKMLQEYADKNQFKVVQQFTDVETAKKAGRTEFNTMLTFVQQHPEIQHILIEKTDRLTRNLPDLAQIDTLINSFAIKVHLVKENVTLSKDSRSHEKFIFGIKGLMAKNFLDNLSEEVRKGMAEKAKQGLYPSGAPYGYFNDKENGKRVIKVDPKTSVFVKQMFELYATGGYSLLNLRKKMLADGMVYRNGRNFYKSTVETILKNPFYMGVFEWKGKRYEHSLHEPIISRELFQQVQTLLLDPRKGKSRKGMFPYNNLISCGLCGCALTSEIKKNAYIYYHCTGAKGNCKQPYIRQEKIESYFEDLLENIHVPQDIQAMILQGLRESMHDKIEYHNNLIGTIEKQIHVLQNRIDQSYLDKLDNKISEEFWRHQTTKWTAEKETLTMKLVNSQRADTHYFENAKLILELSENASRLFKLTTPDQKRQLIKLMVSNCSYAAGKLDVELKPVFRLIMETTKTGNWCAR